MAKLKKKMTTAQKVAKRKAKLPIFFHENEMWECIDDWPEISEDMAQHDS